MSSALGSSFESGDFSSPRNIIVVDQESIIRSLESHARVPVAVTNEVFSGEDQAENVRDVGVPCVVKGIFRTVRGRCIVYNLSERISNLFGALLCADSKESAECVGRQSQRRIIN
jgi:hypothetical protein